jgi:hypothetical protein
VPFCDFLDRPLAVLRMIDEMDVGPERFDDDTEVFDAVEVALGERKFAGIGGTGGLSSMSLTFLRPSDTLRLCCNLTESCISTISLEQGR